MCILFTLPAQEDIVDLQTMLASGPFQCQGPCMLYPSKKCSDVSFGVRSCRRDLGCTPDNSRLEALTSKDTVEVFIKVLLPSV